MMVKKDTGGTAILTVNFFFLVRLIVSKFLMIITIIWFKEGVQMKLIAYFAIIEIID